MIEKVRTINTTAFTMFVFDFADLEGVNRKSLEEKLKHPLTELFDKQRNADKAKKLLKADFPKIVAIYFNDFQNASGFDSVRLGQKLDQSGQVFERHLGKDKVRYLRLLTQLAQAVKEKPKRGLLGAA